jgi:hypothetical protein
MTITPEEAIGRDPSGGSGVISRCAAIKAGGEPCKALPMNGSQWCYSHHPDNAQKHTKNGSKGGRVAGRGRARSTTRELSETRRELREIIAGVRDGTLERGVGTALFQGYSVLFKAVEVERKVRETEELLERVERLEAHDEERERGHRWRA